MLYFAELICYTFVMNVYTDSQIRNIIYKTALAHGFAGMRMLKLHKLDAWHKYSALYGTGCAMPYDLPAAYPDAKAALLLIWAYAPYENGGHISSYYPASNASYHASKAVEAELNAAGIAAERAFIPARALCIANGVGHQGKNGLLSIAPYGTRIALETLLIYSPVEPNAEQVCTEGGCPEGCTACISACPMGAITKNGLNVTRCMRYIMNSGYTEEIWQKQQTFLGCEICQTVCPKNARLKKLPVPDAMAEAFELKRLIAGNAKAARIIAGKNITGSGRLTMEAIAFAAREGQCEAEIRACLSSPFEQVRAAAKWVLSKYFGGI